MKAYIKVTSLLFIFLMIFTHLSCKKEVIEPIIEEEDSIEVVVLTDQELEDLKVIREEEKLARDVYQYAYQQYSLMIFQNISNSEQSHMDQVLVVLDAYGIDDPATDVAGVFNNTDLQDLYDHLVAKVDSSEASALEVGATIEDVDIYDIQSFYDNTDKVEIIDLYTVLECGSRNHMRSFYKKITSGGGTYTPQYISQTEFDEIINSDKETCSN